MPIPAEFVDPVPANATDPDLDYPANAFAFRYVLPTLLSAPGRDFLEIGTGSGAAIETFTEAGFSMRGFDNNDDAVDATRTKARELGLDPSAFNSGDLRDPATYASVAEQGPFDGIVAMGVLPHIHCKQAALLNLFELTAPGGRVFIEFRNSLFALTTYNRFTHALMMDGLLPGVSGEVRQIIDTELGKRLRMDVPGSAARMAEAGEDILEPFDNPLTTPAMFEGAGFVDVAVHYFHFHAGMPYLQSQDPSAFRAADIALEDAAFHATVEGASREGGSNDVTWRGLFLASAFLVEARRPSTETR